MVNFGTCNSLSSSARCLASSSCWAFLISFTLNSYHGFHFDISILVFLSSFWAFVASFMCLAFASMFAFKSIFNNYCIYFIINIISLQVFVADKGYFVYYYFIKASKNMHLCMLIIKKTKKIIAKKNTDTKSIALYSCYNCYYIIFYLEALNNIIIITKKLSNANFFQVFS